MKKFKYLGILLFSAAAVSFTGCSDDDLNPNSIFQTETGERSDFDKWLDKNFVEEYNLDFKYRYNDNETDRNYNVIPATYESSVAMAKLVRHVWLETYVDCAGKDFIRTYTPRVIQLIGSFQYKEGDGITAGSADQGMKVMLYGVNHLDLDNIVVDTEEPYNKSTSPLNLNYWYFHTMHHEFCHILTQTKSYSTDFQTISAGSYHATDWINVDDENAPKQGFVSGYASGEYNEDFAETYAFYVTLSAEGWQKILDMAGETGAPIIQQKIDMVREYFKTSWGIDIDEMRSIVLRRSAEAATLDLRTLD